MKASRMVTKEAVGFIGLGIMGRPMARNLLAQGYSVVAYSRSAPSVTELTELGAVPAISASELARATDVVITMLPDSPDVEQVLAGPQGVLEGIRPGSLLIDMSTIDPAVARQMSELALDRSARFLDAPVSGGERGARDATLSIMVGGDREDFARAEPIFRALGKSVVLVGNVGSGQVAKACNQLIVAATIEIVAEALLLASKAGVDPGAVRDALQGGFAGSRVLDQHGQRMLDRDFSPGFRSRLHQKDARIVRDLAKSVGMPIPSFLPAADALDRIVESGRGDLDHSSILLALEEDADFTLPSSPSGR